MSNRWIFKSLLAVITVGSVGFFTSASDHDDGISAVKEKNLNLTDLYVFREDNQTGRASDKGNLILIMNSNPRAIGGQQEHFNTNGRYDFNITRVAADNKNATPTGTEDIVLRFEFSAPDENQRQTIMISAIKDGQTIAAMPMDEDGQLMTTSMADAKAGHYKANTFQLGDHHMKVFAGLREDPFFFDVDTFFAVRAGAAGLGPATSFKKPSEAVDFTNGFNVNSIVVRVPIAFLQSEAQEPVFDVWETVSLK